MKAKCKKASQFVKSFLFTFVYSSPFSFLKVLDINLLSDVPEDVSTSGGHPGSSVLSTSGDAFLDEPAATTCGSIASPPTLGLTSKDNSSGIGSENVQSAGRSSARRIGSSSSYHTTSTSEKDFKIFIAIRSGVRHFPAGFQPELICRLGVPCLNLDIGNNGGGPLDSIADASILPPPSISLITFCSGFQMRVTNLAIAYKSFKQISLVSLYLLVEIL
ncbi:unnamed protein product [Protopolystoma xenopodis]|uniref:Uncharacterized protein n=1 Tax=Protopolystoma xenopodis TaxID=117903 RepID=A0A3S4ZIK2_9PLAT|nr:unnamed protein product [Protopolystoma xenopodis]